MRFHILILHLQTSATLTTVQATAEKCRLVRQDINVNVGPTCQATLSWEVTRIVGTQAAQTRHGAS